MFDMGQVLMLSKNLSMTVCRAWLKMAGGTGKPKAPVRSLKERPFASSFPMA